MQNLKRVKPQPFRHFTAIDINTAESFPNCLIMSEFNKFYIAGRPFTHWLEMKQPEVEKELECCTKKAAKILINRKGVE